MKILVTGAGGFIGGGVCRAALEAGHRVVGVARSGKPAGGAGWTERVAWVAADVLKPETWRAHLEGCGAVIHCVGIIRERPERGITFERMSGDAGVVAVGEAERAGVGAFVFFSASAKPPFIPESYITAKRRAEKAVLAARLRGVVFRPGLVYGPGRAVAALPAMMVQLATRLPIVGAKARESRPLRVETVARAAVRAAEDASVAGVVDIDAIEGLGRS